MKELEEVGTYTGIQGGFLRRLEIGMAATIIQVATDISMQNLLEEEDMETTLTYGRTEEYVDTLSEKKQSELRRKTYEN